MRRLKDILVQGAPVAEAQALYLYSRFTFDPLANIVLPGGEDIYIPNSMLNFEKLFDRLYYAEGLKSVDWALLVEKHPNPESAERTFRFDKLDTIYPGLTRVDLKPK